MNWLHFFRNYLVLKKNKGGFTGKYSQETSTDFN